jgi:putative FmdB family regulatory protein
MPTYDYECSACGHKFEKFQPITAKPIRKCPICSRSTVKRLLGTGAGIIFKGSGFYCTDYRSDSYKKAAGNDKPSASATAEGSKGESSSTPKSDAPKPAKPKGAKEGK